jgi:hypothetical protein
MTQADAKLHHTLEDNPGVLTQKQNTVTLLDNGNAANGDSQAGDGIYSALYTPQIPGHYNFLFGVEGATKDLGRFSRQQLRTVVVRAVPDPDATETQTTIDPGPPQVLIINLTPRTKFNHRMGPGWANYFWFTAPGVTPFKAKDNLNGTYTATLRFAGTISPPISVHFIDESIEIADSVPPEKLPEPLDDKNVVIKNIPGTGPKDRFALLLGAGVAIPQGNFNIFLDPGFSFNAGIEHMVTPQISLVGLFGYHRLGTADSIPVPAA